MLAAVTVAARADEASDAALREQFRVAYAAVDVALAPDDDALRAYVLYPYLRAARIARALERATGTQSQPDLEAAEFLAETGDAPVARALRRAWLASLARRNSWDAFLERYDDSVATPLLQCQRLNARIARAATDGLAAEIRSRWLTPYRLPTECEPAFQWLRAQNELPDELIAQRATRLLDAGQASFARIVAARLPRDAAAPLLERADFIESPGRMLDALLRDPARAVPGNVVLEAWSRLARNAPDAALARFGDLTERTATAVQPHELALALALGLAWDRRAEALDYFARVPATALDDADREWQTRAALWAGDWESVRATIAAMPAAQQSEWAWRYWAARAVEQRGDGAAARTLYAAVLDGDNYYSALAAAHLGERVVPRVEPLPLDPATVDTIAALDAFRRVRELLLVGQRQLARTEWNYGYELLPDEQRLQAIHLAARLGIYDIAVETATSYGQFNDYPLLYPRPYADEVAAAVKLTDVEPPLLYGVLRQESLFRPDAASSAGALGVAQLTHATARETARRWRLPAPKREDLFDPAVNITLGAARFAELLEQFDAQLPLALGAYNAGTAAVERWLPAQPIDSDVWIENIPYNETRAYVRRVLWHSLVFSWLESGRAQSARDWLGKVERPRKSPAAESTSQHR
ncbi:MAG TPA: transglycosylase SLT domain-containing protein [Gammaproteobacteria bacterium]|nr:transglycosylase SLT domain-containing protein [Gammaproteobacteria bacterium]